MRRMRSVRCMRRVRGMARCGSEWSDSPLEMRCVALDAYHKRLGASEEELLA